MSDGLDRQQFVAGYLIEAEEHLRLASANLLSIEAALQKGRAEPARLRELFRSLHTLKGLSAMVGVEPIVEIAHELEAIVRVADTTMGLLSLPALELLLQGVRAIELRVAAFAARGPVEPAPRELLEALAAVQLGAAPAAPSGESIDLPAELLGKLGPAERLQLVQGVREGRRVVRIDYVPSPEKTARGITITAVRERVGKLAEIVKVVPLALPKDEKARGALAFVLLVLSNAELEALAEAADVSPADLALVSIKTGDAPVRGVGSSANGLTDEGLDAPLRTGSIRVDVARLDDALEKLSELVVTRFRLHRAVAQLREQGVEVRELASIVDDASRQLRDLRASIARARLLPVAELLERVPLIVRGMSHSTGKPVRLQIDAGTTALDKSVAEKIFPAIVHLVRNAVDHAIETSAERRALGKPDAGLISVSCFEHANNVLELRVADDGRGIDAAAVARKARRELPKNDHELLQLLTLPGFSTLEQPTHSSGRGMGMEIVQRVAEGTLGGSLSMTTSLGRGTVFTLRLPVSISIVDSFAFLCGGAAFVVPVSSVEEIVEVDVSRLITPPGVRAGALPIQLLQRRGEAVPLVPLSGIFSGVAVPLVAASKALVVRRNGEPFAFAVDRMLGQQEIVVRPLEDPLVRVGGITGTTDLGDGKPTLVLDLAGLVSAAHREVSQA